MKILLTCVSMLGLSLPFCVQAEEPATGKIASALQDRGKATQCLNQTKAFVVALVSYALDHDQKLPMSLDDLGAAIDKPAKEIACPFDPKLVGGGYELLQPGKAVFAIENPAMTRLVQARALSPDGFRSVGFVDGHVERVKEEPKK